jgi:hypothetical protein
MIDGGVAVLCSWVHVGFSTNRVVVLVATVVQIFRALRVADWPLHRHFASSWLECSSACHGGLPCDGESVHQSSHQ